MLSHGFIGSMFALILHVLSHPLSLSAPLFFICCTRVLQHGRIYCKSTASHLDERAFSVLFNLRMFHVDLYVCLPARWEMGGIHKSGSLNLTSDVHDVLFINLTSCKESQRIPSNEQMNMVFKNLQKKKQSVSK